MNDTTANRATLTLSRREAIRTMALAMGALVAGSRLRAAEFGGPDQAALTLGAAEITLLDELGDTIIPATDVPGAKAAGIGAFIAMMMRDCQSAREQADFRAGLAELAEVFEQRFGRPFVASVPKERLTFLNELDHRVSARQAHDRQSRDHRAVTSWPKAELAFRNVKELTILGYFTSETGCTQALRFIEVPGRYDGAADYRPGDHNWFTQVQW